MKLSLIVLQLIVFGLNQSIGIPFNLTYRSQIELPSTQLDDSLSFKSVRINSKIPLKLTVKELVQEFGQPDSIKSEHWGCGNYINSNEEVEIYFYGHSRFLVTEGNALLHKYYPTDKKMVFGTVDFQLFGEVNESKLKELFPNSFNNMTEGNDNGKPNGENILSVRMKDSNLDYGNGFIFHFRNHELMYVELWWFIC